MIQITPTPIWTNPVAPDNTDISIYQTFSNRDQYLYQVLGKQHILLDLLSAKIQQLAVVTAAIEIKLTKLAALFEFFNNELIMKQGLPGPPGICDLESFNLNLVEEFNNELNDKID